MFRFIIITLIVFLSADPIIARDKMIFSTFPDSDTPNIVIANTIISEVYNRLEMDIEVKYQPGYRALKQANTGKVDGLLFHVPGLGIPYANLIQVKAPVFHSQLVGFFNNKSIEIKDWDGLNRYRIGYVRGFVLVKNHLNDAQTVAVDEQEDMMKMLSKGRIDVAVDTYLTGLYTIKKLDLNGIKVTSPPLETFFSFHYLHKKHSNLIPQVEFILSKMEKEGSTLAIRNKILQTLLDEK